MSTEWVNTNRDLLGKRVAALIDYERGVVSIGKLMGFGEGGDFEVLEDDGFLHYCWPLLSIEEIPDTVHRGNWGEYAKSRADSSG